MTLSRVQTSSSPGTAALSGAPAVHVVTFGCQMNKYDSLLVEGRFRERGYRLTEDMSDADVILFNTCSVREHAEERVYSWLGELKSAKERRRDLVIGVMGCMAQRAEAEIFQRAAHVDIVCGTRKLHRLPQLVDEVRSRRARPALPPRERRLLEVGMDEDLEIDRDGEVYAGGLTGHLTIMRGCDLNCTFCIVPRVRGRVRSRTIEELVREARWMVGGGARVITLLGQTVDAFGEDLPGAPGGRGRGGRPSLADLLYELQEIEGLARIRLVTLHPSYTTRALARAIAECDKVDRFLPLPAQSGSDRVLKRMKRGYTVELYRRRVEVLREEVADLELGSDWIVGFPGESETDFARTIELLEEWRFVQNYVFQYSPRPGTRAFDLEDDVPQTVKGERNRRLLAVAERVALSSLATRIGSTLDVFVEDRSRRDGILRGRSFHNLPVSFDGGAENIGRTVRVRIEDASPFGLWGALESGPTIDPGPARP